MPSNIRDPERDPDAALADFVYRLRRMGYPGNVRVEFPVYTVEDVRWVCKIVSDASLALINLTKDMTMNPLHRVLSARSIIVAMDKELKRRTTHNRVRKELRG